jgi:hypothetical protein
MQNATLAGLVRIHITAKDTNRPHLVERAFARTAVLESCDLGLPRHRRPTTDERKGRGAINARQEVGRQT